MLTGGLTSALLDLTSDQSKKYAWVSYPGGPLGLMSLMLISLYAG